MKVHCIKHVPFEGPGAIADWAAELGHEMVYYKAYLDQQFPDPSDKGLVVVMGGPMNIYEYDEHPWLRQERAYLKSAVQAGATMLGICLGAQLLADVLGGKVTKGEPEIGFFPVEKTPGAEETELFRAFPDVFNVLHWHGDTFSIPDGALRVAQSLNCANQGFVWKDRVVGLQFHLESTEESLKAIMENCPEDMAQAAPCVQAESEIKDRLELLKPMHGLLFGLMDRLAAKAESGQ